MYKWAYYLKDPFLTPLNVRWEMKSTATKTTANNCEDLLLFFDQCYSKPNIFWVFTVRHFLT